MSFWELISKYLFSWLFLNAAWATLWISVIAQACGCLIGLVLALMRMSRFRGFSSIARFYVWLFRGSPLLVQILILYDGVPQVFPSLTKYLTVYSVALIAFSFNEGAYMAEIIRAGIASVDAGQMEAAKALGMRYPLAMRRIILPQAARVIIPPLGNEFNNMLKTTSLASVVGLFELTYTAQVYGSQDFIIFQLLIVATAYYLVLTTLWGYVQTWIENRMDPNRSTKDTLVSQKGGFERIFGFGGGSSRTGGTVVSGH